MTEMIDPSGYIVTSQANLHECMEVINTNVSRVVFVCVSDKLVGSVSDGDIRRHLLRGGSTNDMCSDVMNTSPVYVSETVEGWEKKLEGLQIANPQVSVIPVVDLHGSIRGIVKKEGRPSFPIYEPLLYGKELIYLSDCIDTNWISSQGAYVTEFEQSIGRLIGQDYSSLAVCNGTAALMLAISALRLGNGDKIAVPSLTFAATVNAIIHSGAEPVFVDVDKDTWCITPETLDEALQYGIKGFISVDLYGNSCKSDRLSEFAKSNDLVFIEDAAEALGTYYRNRHVGSYSDAVTFSFFGNKTVTTGEGGMVSFRSYEAFERAKVLRDHGMSPNKRYWHEVVGFNYRLTNIQAALGVAQMERLGDIVEKKRYIFDAYKRRLSGQVVFQKDTEECRSSYWLASATVSVSNKIEDILEKSKAANIEVRRGFYPVHTMPPYRGYSKTCMKNTLSLSERIISLPSAPRLGECDIDYICSRMASVVLPL